MFFFFNDTATTEIYTLSLHDALPISDVPAVREYAKTLPHVVHVEDNLFTCSQDTQMSIVERIKEQGLNRVIVASCTPRTHEPLFQETIREAGLNPHLFEMANIRDQCSWVHMHEHEAATEKSKDLLRMAVTKVALAVALKSISLPVTQKALIVGGGLAGLTSSLAIAEQGFEVFLIEKTGSLGGIACKIDQTLSGYDVNRYLGDLIDNVRSNKLINLHTGTEIINVGGFVGNFISTVRKQGNGQGPEEFEIEHGVAIVATGASESKPSEYLYGKNSCVKTLLELDELISAADFKVPDSVVIIQCVGSREPDHPYCSRVCCQGAIKNAIRMKRAKPAANIFILYRDIRTYGFREKYYSEARELGIIFVRYDLDAKPEVTEEMGEIKVRVYDPVLEAELEIPTDLIVLSSRIDPNKDRSEEHTSELQSH